MGLDFDHSDASWGYIGFNRFREKLAAEIGITWENMDGIKKEGGLKWENVLDPIGPLLIHSDCEGHLTPTECKAIAPRLRKLVSSWPDIDYDKGAAIKLAKGMEWCAKNKKKLTFT